MARDSVAGVGPHATAMSYPFPKHRIDEIVGARKSLLAGQALRIERRGEHGGSFRNDAELIDGPYVDLRFLGKATHLARPSTYDSSLILAAERIRGVGYQAVGRNNLRAKRRIPAGWHQNFCDPNLPTLHSERERHEPLPGFAPTDFGDFINRCADLWKIDLPADAPLL